MSKAIAKKHEGLRLKAYPDPASGGDPWTIGYGHTRGVRKGDTCTLEQAEAWFEEDWAEAQRVIDKAVTVPLSEKQRDALTSFVFNVGPGRKGVKDGFVQLKNGNQSTMLRKLNAGDYRGAAEQLLLWTRGAGKVMPGLVKRRGEERAYFLAGTDINPEPFVTEEKPVAPFLAAAIPALVSALPEFAKIFSKPDVSERNVEAVVKASELIMQATGSVNVQEAVEKVQADPELAQVANESLRANRAELMDMLERMIDKDEASVAAARVHAAQEKPVWGNWHFVHILSLVLVLLGSVVAGYVIMTSDEPTERVMALQTVLVVGFVSVVAFWLGSSRSSQMKDVMRDERRL